jgi:hypothetical protein
MLIIIIQSTPDASMSGNKKSAMFAAPPIKARPWRCEGLRQVISCLSPFEEVLGVMPSPSTQHLWLEFSDVEEQGHSDRDDELRKSGCGTAAVETMDSIGP